MIIRRLGLVNCLQLSKQSKHRMYLWSSQKKNGKNVFSKFNVLNPLPTSNNHLFTNSSTTPPAAAGGSTDPTSHQQTPYPGPSPSDSAGHYSHQYTSHHLNMCIKKKGTHAFKPPATRLGSLFCCRILYRSSRGWSPWISLLRTSLACSLASLETRGLCRVLLSF